MFYWVNQGKTYKEEKEGRLFMGPFAKQGWEIFFLLDEYEKTSPKRSSVQL